MRTPYNHADIVRFKQYFDLDLKTYWETLSFLGLDVIKLHEELSPPDNISLYDYICNTISHEAADFVMELSKPIICR